MALTSALNMAISGMMTTAIKTSLTSQNITNADKAGYTRKELQVKYMTSNSGSTPTAGTVVGAQDKFLHIALNRDTSVYTKDNVVSSSLDYYVKLLGTTDGTNTFSSYMNSLYSSLQYLSTNPDAPADRSTTVEVASNLAGSLRSVSDGIQNLRLEAEHKINSSIDNINAIVQRIDVLNQKVSSNGLNDAGLAEYEDQRAQELTNLAKEMNIQYYYTSDNRVQIYTGSGQTLLAADPHPITYAVTNAVNGTTLYPTNFSPITLNGVDLTTSITGGNLGGYIELRDKTYVDEQDKMNEFATTLQTQVNTVLNQGASVPARNVTVGSLKGLTAGTAFTGTGNIQVAVTDNTGKIVNTASINLATMSTVSDVLTALNGVAGIAASLTANGELSITASPSTNGVAINQLATTVTSSTGQGFAQYFGLNDMFTGTSAEDIAVSSYLTAGPQYLAVGKLDITAAVGSRGVAKGDGSIAQALSDLLTDTTTSFATAGNFSAQATSLITYAQAIMSDAASQASITQQETDTTYQVYKASNDIVTSKEGVNVDEETAKLLVQQNQYQAGAQVVKTVRDMMQTLLDAMR